MNPALFACVVVGLSLLSLGKAGKLLRQGRGFLTLGNEHFKQVRFKLEQFFGKPLDRFRVVLVIQYGLRDAPDSERSESV
jgi:hypothetical protein